MSEALASKGLSTRTLIIGGAAALFLGFLGGFYVENWSFGIIFAVVIFAIFWGVSALLRKSRTRSLQAAEEFLDRPRVPVGVTADGTAVYAAELSPGTATGVYPNAGTNTFAILALVFGVLGGALAIPFGHIARSQIRRTREGGAGLALAGLILGYFWVAIIAAILIVATVVALAQR